MFPENPAGVGAFSEVVAVDRDGSLRSGTDAYDEESSTLALVRLARPPSSLVAPLVCLSGKLPEVPMDPGVPGRPAVAPTLADLTSPPPCSLSRSPADPPFVFFSPENLSISE